MYKFIRIKGERANVIGFFVPRLYRLNAGWWILKTKSFWYLLDRISGWHIWWVYNEEDLAQAVKSLDELKKTNIFTYEVSM